MSRCGLLNWSTHVSIARFSFLPPYWLKEQVKGPGKAHLSMPLPVVSFPKCQTLTFIRLICRGCKGIDLRYLRLWESIMIITPCVQMVNVLLMYLYYTRGNLFWVCKKFCSNFSVNRLAYDDPLCVPLAVPCGCRYSTLREMWMCTFQGLGVSADGLGRWRPLGDQNEPTNWQSLVYPLCSPSQPNDNPTHH